MKRILSIFAVAMAVQTLGVNAAVLLIIDITNPSAVKFTATSGVSSGTSSLMLASDGITFIDILKAGANLPNTDIVPVEQAVSNLVPTQSPASTGGIVSRYTGMGSFNFDTGNGDLGPGNDLGLYQNGGSGVNGSQVFTNGLQAFKGESVFNLSAFTSILPAAGVTGNILSGYLPSGNGHGLVLGQYSVIPEPSSIALGALAAAAIATRRRRH